MSQLQKCDILKLPMMENEENARLLVSEAMSNDEGKSTKQPNSTIYINNTDRFNRDGQLYTNRIIASPHRTQTQIAKISYGTNMQSAWLSCGQKEMNSRSGSDKQKDTVTVIPLQSTLHHNSKDYLPVQTTTERQPRTQLKMEVLASASQRHGHSTTIELNRNVNIEIVARRSKNLITGTSRAVRSCPSPSKSTQSSEQQQAQQNCNNRRLAHNTFKKKTIYVDATATAKKTELEKAKIKERLAKLHENTRQLLSKNLQKRKLKERKSTPKAISTDISKEELVYLFDKNDEAPLRASISESMNGFKYGNRTQPLAENSNVNANNVSHNQRHKCEESLGNSDTAPLIVNKAQRVGLLRNPDMGSSCTYNMSSEKENLILRTKKTKPSPDVYNDCQVENVVRKQNLEHKTNIVPDSDAAKNQTKKYQVCDTGGDVSALIPPAPHTAQNELSYWLRPSPVQIYPYNFILAVRRKLEAIVKPELTHTKTTSTTDLGNNLHARTAKSTENEAQIERIETATRVVQPCNAALTKTIGTQCESGIISLKSTNIEKIRDLGLTFTNNNKSQKKNDFTKVSNINSLSSISVGNLSQLESVSKSNVQLYEDDETTISSSVFDSPQKRSSARAIDHIQRAASPLTLDHVEPLRIHSKRRLEAAINKKHIAVQRGDSLCTPAKDIESPEIKLSELLCDFNRSLSEAIQVNEQLKQKTSTNYRISGTLSARCEKDIISPVYSSDFESLSDRNAAAENGNQPTSSTAKSSLRLEPSMSGENNSCKKPSAIKIFGDHHGKQSEKLQLDKDKNDHAVGSADVSPISQPMRDERPLITANGGENATTHTTAFTSSNACGMRGIPIDIQVQRQVTSSSDCSISEEVLYQYEPPNRSSKEPNMQKSSAGHNICQADSDEDVASNATTVSLKQQKINTISTGIPAISKTKFDVKSASYGREILTIFNQSDLELPQLNAYQSDSSSMNYSSVGLYEKLIKAETSKSDHLTVLLKMREKVLIDRTNSQIAWLEVLKQRYKAKGLLSHIVAIKKKQRGIYLKMEKEREEIKRLLQNTLSKSATTTTTTTSESSPTKRLRRQFHSPKRRTAPSTRSDLLLSAPQPPSSLVSPKATRTHQQRQHQHQQKSTSIVRGVYDIESSQSLEELLRRRELELRRRRTHVEQLIQWHQRLDHEEAEVRHLEEKLAYCSARQPLAVGSSIGKKRWEEQQSQSLCNAKMERRLMEIDRSLQELSSISSATSVGITAATAAGIVSDTEAPTLEYVCTTGSKLNALWRRLTSQHTERYVPTRRYKLCKSDLEQLYEEAKVAVLKEFVQDEQRIAKELLEKSEISNKNATTSVTASGAALNCGENTKINLSEDAAAVTVHSDQEIEFNDNVEEDEDDVPAESSEEANLTMKEIENCECDIASVERQITDSENETMFSARQEIVDRNELIQRNIKKFVELTRMLVTQHTGLQRSLSDNQIDAHDAETNERNRLSNVHASTSLMPLSFSPLPSYESRLNDSNKLPNGERFLTAVDRTEPDSSNEVQSKCTVNSDRTSATIPEKYVDLVQQNAEVASREKSLPSYESIQKCMEHPPIDISHGLAAAAQSQLKDSSADVDGIVIMSRAFTKDPSSSPHSRSNEAPSYYEGDFESFSSGEDTTRLEDVSMPNFEITMETTQEEAENSLALSSIAELRQINLVAEGTLSSAQSLSQTAHQSSKLTKSATCNAVSQLMPDIINNLEERRTATSQPDAMDSELNTKQQQQQQLTKHHDNNSIPSQVVVPYGYTREIPNKPPPPYVPPAPGSPMTTIFPSEERIRDITFRRTHELYCEHSKTDYISARTGEKLPSVMDEKITNIYERIILDICREYLNEHKEVLCQGNPVNFHSHLAFFNPPDRLRCIQNSIYKEVRHCLAMNKASTKRTPIYSVYGHRARRDHIGKIIIQEMFEEDEQWCNYHPEENEVIELMIEEMIAMQVQTLIKEVWLENDAMVIPPPPAILAGDPNDNVHSTEIECSNETISTPPNVENST